MIEPDFIAFLATKATAANGIYSHKAPSGAALPHIVFAVTDTEHHKDASGAAGLAETEFTIESKATTSQGARELNEQCRQVDGFSGAMGSSTVDSVWFEGGGESYEQPTDASEQGRYVRTATVRVKHRESIPVHA